MTMARIFLFGLAMMACCQQLQAFSLGARIFSAPQAGRSPRVCWSMSEKSTPKQADVEMPLRRSTVAGALLSMLTPMALVSNRQPASAKGEVYADEERGFQIAVPEGWVKGTAEFPGANQNPARPKIISYVNPTNKDINVAIVSYSIQPDYSKLGSLGSIEDVAGTILGRSGNLDAEMYKQSEGKIGAVPGYTFDYRIRDKHLLTAFAVQPGEWAGNFLVTLTVQAPVTDFKASEAVMREVMASFQLSKRD